MRTRLPVIPARAMRALTGKQQVTAPVVSGVRAESTDKASKKAAVIGRGPTCVSRDIDLVVPASVHVGSGRLRAITRL
jgi:hypothetical protein